MLGLRLLIAVITCGKIKFTAARKPEWTIPGRPLKDTGSANKSCNQSRKLSGSLGGRVPRNATMIPIADCPTRQALMLFAVTAVGGRGVVDGVAENRVGRILGCHRVNVVSGTARAEQGIIQRKVHTVGLFLTLNVGPVVPNPQANVFTRRSLVPTSLTPYVKAHGTATDLAAKQYAYTANAALQAQIPYYALFLGVTVTLVDANTPFTQLVYTRALTVSGLGTVDFSNSSGSAFNPNTGAAFYRSPIDSACAIARYFSSETPAKKNGNDSPSLLLNG